MQGEDEICNFLGPLIYTMIKQNASFFLLAPFWRGLRSKNQKMYVYEIFCVNYA